LYHENLKWTFFEVLIWNFPGTNLGSLFALVLAGSVFVKWGSLLIDLPFEPDLATALAVIAIPSIVNCLTWAKRS